MRSDQDRLTEVWWQLITVFMFTCDCSHRKEGGRKQEDPPVKTVKQGWSERESLHLLCYLLIRGTQAFLSSFYQQVRSHIGRSIVQVRNPLTSLLTRSLQKNMEPPIEFCRVIDGYYWGISNKLSVSWMLLTGQEGMWGAGPSFSRHLLCLLGLELEQNISIVSTNQIWSKLFSHNNINVTNMNGIWSAF